jgi:hypothetical protein
MKIIIFNHRATRIKFKILRGDFMKHKTEYEKIKYEIASELGINFKEGYNGNLSAKDAGRLGGVIGGNMVRTMVEYAEENLSKKE